jgi:ABC-type transport system involved in multi-copper enzyme maturation permease subunit
MTITTSPLPAADQASPIPAAVSEPDGRAVRSSARSSTGNRSRISTVTALRAEWIKLRTVRSTWTAAGGAAVLSLGMAVISAASQMSQWDGMTPEQRADVDPTATALVGVLFATVIFGSLGVRSVTAEYSSGMIRQTFAAVPRRRAVLLAKVVDLAVLALPVALVSTVASFLLGQSILASKGAEAALGDPGVAGAIVYGSLAVTTVVVLGVGLGAVLRHTAAATSVVSVLIIGSQIFAVAVPSGARPYLPGLALQATVTVSPSDDLLGPVAGLLVLAAYAAVAIAGAAWVIGKRDA